MRIDQAGSLPARIARHAAAAGDALAVTDATRPLTYAQLDARSNQLAHLLREAGAAPENCVGLLLERSVDFVIAALAVLKSGAAYLPLDASAPAERNSFALQDAGATILLAHRGTARSFPSGNWRTVELDGPAGSQIAAQPATPLAEPPAPDQLAYVIYTSGSTGRPKGVEITHANLCNLVDWHQAAFGVTAADRASQVAGLGFDAAVWELWPHLAAGASVSFADEVTRRSPQSLHDWLVAERITIAFVPTVLAESLLRTTWPPETALRVLLTGADALHRRPVAGLPFVVVNNYGPTECTVVATSGPVAPEGGGADGVPSIGRPITNTAAFLLDDALRPVAPGEPGELCLAGAHVGRGYRNDPELTRTRFVTFVPPSGAPCRVYRTGDRARLLANGEIAFLGRFDDQVKIRGYRVEPGEVAACLDRCDGVAGAAVVLRDGEPGGPALVGYVVPAPGARLTADALRRHLAAKLPEYMIPARYVLVPSLPMTPNGKLDRVALPEPGPANLVPAAPTSGNVAAAPPTNGASAPAAPPADVEERIAAMVASLLKQPSVNRSDNFFMSGGHSMLGVQLVAQVSDAFKVRLTLRQLFGAPTVAALSAEVARLTAPREGRN